MISPKPQRKVPKEVWIHGVGCAAIGVYMSPRFRKNDAWWKRRYILPPKKSPTTSARLQVAVVKAAIKRMRYGTWTDHMLELRIQQNKRHGDDCLECATARLELYRRSSGRGKKK